MGAMWTDDDLGDEPSTQSMGSSHLDSPMERQAARERAEQGKKNATGALFKGGEAGRVADRANEVKTYKDADGDGHISLLEKFDLDGDGKIEMHEFAATTNSLSGTAGGVKEAYAADFVGAGRAPQSKNHWAQLRTAQSAGKFVPSISSRVQESGAAEQIAFIPSAGGWINVSPPGQRAGSWKVPGGPSGNLNVKSPSSSPDGNPFSSRMFSGSHYAVADRSSETYAYSGARGIFKNVDAESHIPDHYKHDIERQQAIKVLKQFNHGHNNAPGTSVAMRGGWPAQATYGQLPQGGRYGWSIERATQPTNDTWSRASQ